MKNILRIVRPIFIFKILIFQSNLFLNISKIQKIKLSTNVFQQLLLFQERRRERYPCINDLH